jgi:hypothetical protein
MALLLPIYKTVPESEVLVPEGAAPSVIDRATPSVYNTGSLDVELLLYDTATCCDVPHVRISELTYQ